MRPGPLVHLKPVTELGLIIHALTIYDEGRGMNHPAYATAHDVWSQFPDMDVHEDMGPDDVAAFVPMLNELEETVGVPFTNEELWYTHGVMDWYSNVVRKGCWLSRSIFEELTDAVAELDTPPY